MCYIFLKLNKNKGIKTMLVSSISFLKQKGLCFCLTFYWFISSHRSSKTLLLVLLTATEDFFSILFSRQRFLSKEKESPDDHKRWLRIGWSSFLWGKRNNIFLHKNWEMCSIGKRFLGRKETIKIWDKKELCYIKRTKGLEFWMGFYFSDVMFGLW